MGEFRLERFVLRSTKGLKVDNSKATGEPLLPRKKAAAKGGALSKPLKPSAELAQIIGSAPLPRAEVISKVWDHIRKNNLQNPNNKREILADDKLRKIFGTDRCTMFEMNKHLSKHLDPGGDTRAATKSRSDVKRKRA